MGAAAAGEQNAGGQFGQATAVAGIESAGQDGEGGGHFRGQLPQ